jgi:ABC-type amino acid transport system permease subunit
MLKLQTSVVRLISNVERVTFYRKQFNTLNINSVPYIYVCVYIIYIHINMVIVYYIKLHMGTLEQNLVRHGYTRCLRSDL